jgi:hypothetical protein
MEKMHYSLEDELVAFLSNEGRDKFCEVYDIHPVSAGELENCELVQIALAVEQSNRFK